MDREPYKRRTVTPDLLPSVDVTVGAGKHLSTRTPGVRRMGHTLSGFPLPPSSTSDGCVSGTTTRKTFVVTQELPFVLDTSSEGSSGDTVQTLRKCFGNRFRQEILFRGSPTLVSNRSVRWGQSCHSRDSEFVPSVNRQK